MGVQTIYSTPVRADGIGSGVDTQWPETDTLAVGVAYRQHRSETDSHCPGKRARTCASNEY